MKYGVVDIGSNSVRLMINKDGKTLYKLVKITRLAEGMGDEKILKAQSVDRTVSAVSFFKEKAHQENVDELFVFATAAVRMAKNKDYFVSELKKVTNLCVDVISGEDEAYFGGLGVLKGADGGVVDIGGASAEISVFNGDLQVYSKSLNIGVVKVKDVCGQDQEKAREFILEKISGYGLVPNAKFFGIGGTATSLASLALELDPYDPEKIDGYELSIEKIKQLSDLLYGLKIEDRAKLKGLQPERAEVIAGGALLMYEILNKLQAKSIVVSEGDNLEGYLINKGLI